MPPCLEDPLQKRRLNAISTWKSLSAWLADFPLRLIDLHSPVLSPPPAVRHLRHPKPPHDFTDTHPLGQKHFSFSQLRDNLFVGRDPDGAVPRGRDTVSPRIGTKA